MPQNRSRSVPGPTVLADCVESRSEVSHGFTGTALISHTSIDTDLGIVLSCPNNIYACGQYDLESGSLRIPKHIETCQKAMIYAFKNNSSVVTNLQLLPDNCTKNDALTGTYLIDRLIGIFDDRRSKV